MGIKGNESLVIILLGLGVVAVIAAAVLFRVYRFYIDNNKNKAIQLRRIRRKTATTTPQREGNLESGGEAA